MNEESATKRNHCSAKRKDGQSCQAQRLPGSEFCFAHDPDRKEQRDAARAQGGKNRANIVRLRGLVPPRLLPIFDKLETALGEVHAGELHPNQAQAMASLARAMVAVLTSGELEERVRKIVRLAEEEQSA